MSLKYETETLDGVDTAFHSLYEQTDTGYRLKVEGIDPADELKGALNKQREETKAAKARLSELEKLREEAEKKAMEEQGKYKELSERERTDKLNAQKQFEELQRKVATSKRDLMLRELAQSMTTDPLEIDIISRFAVDFVEIEGEEVKFSKDEKALREELSRFVRSKASGTNDGGNKGKGGNSPTKTRGEFDQLSQSERMKFFRDGGSITE